MNKIMEAMKYIAALFQIETKHLEYLQAIYKYKTQGKVVFPNTLVRLKGLKFHARKNTMDIAHLSNLYEKNTTKFMLEKNPKNFIDIGAHIGRFSLLLGSRGSNVISIEASKNTFDQLIRNIELSGLQKKINAINVGCSNENGESDLYLGETNEGANSILRHKNSRVEKIKTRKLDTITEGFKLSPKAISMIKVDVEGLELEVLKGAKEILEKGRPILVLEILTKEEEKKIKQFLGKLGFHVSKVLDSRNFVFVKL